MTRRKGRGTMPPGGGKLQYLTDEEVLDGIVRHGDNKAAYARELGVSGNAVRNRIKKIQERLQEEGKASADAFRMLRSDFALGNKKSFEEFSETMTALDGLKQIAFSAWEGVKDTEKMILKDREERGEPRPFVLKQHQEALRTAMNAIQAVSKQEGVIHTRTGQMAFIGSVVSTLVEMGPDATQTFFDKLRKYGLAGSIDARIEQIRQEEMQSESTPK